MHLVLDLENEKGLKFFCIVRVRAYKGQLSLVLSLGC